MSDMFSTQIERRSVRSVNNTQGFTLIEIMVVVVILGILAGLIVPNFITKVDDAKVTKAKVQISALEQAIKFYKLDNGSYPSTEQGLQALVEPPAVGSLAKKWKEGGYLEKGKVPMDPWGNEYVYIAPGLHSDFDLMSYGSDGEPGGDGYDTDINNWEIE